MSEDVVIKICQTCGKPIDRSKNESYKRYLNRKYHAGCVKTANHPWKKLFLKKLK